MADVVPVKAIRTGADVTALGEMISTDTIAATRVNITGATDIGANLADDDELPVYDLSATANRKSALSRFWTYFSSKMSAAANVFTAAQTISVTDNTNPALKITQAGTGHCLVVEDVASDTTPFVIDANGNVGIGVAPPKSKLQVAGDVVTPYNAFISSNIYYDNGWKYVGNGYAGVLKLSATEGETQFIRFDNNQSGADAAGTGVASLYIKNSGNVLIATNTDNSSGAKLQVNGAITAGDGSASLPSYSNSDDPNTGIYFPAADSVAIATGGTERIQIDANGNVGIGAAADDGRSLQVSNLLTGAVSSVGVRSDGTIQSDVTTEAVYFQTVVNTQATPFTLANVTHYQANQIAFSGGSAVTIQIGFLASSLLTGATNNYGFFGNIAAATGCWNFYAAGTAQNYFAGNVILKLASSVTPANNGELMIEATSNTSLTFKYKGSDGVVRSASLTLA